ncbi:MAG: DNA repair protein RadA [Candidatus Gastranaerophilales bacterium]|nr:DNA repair protein RadA [Candidatus Gastranaerophilales bacterium]
MAKVKSKWVCQSCGYEAPAYLGKCPECSSWGTFIEEAETISKIQPQHENKTFFENNIQKINDIIIDETFRFSTGLEEFDRVLGGGLVEGSLVLIAGDPGIGKSTLILQACSYLSNNNVEVLYISAEESVRQLKSRAKRLKVTGNLNVLSQTNVEEIKSAIFETKPKVVVIDSIQAIYSPAITSSPGSVSQVREACNTFMEIAKTTGTTIIIVGHVTKDGTIAGPRVLEHMVDTVLQFEGEKYKFFRMLRAVKNRFGSTNEVGIFNMKDTGLEEVQNPSELFLEGRKEASASGSVIIVTNEGTRPLLVELQALTGFTSYPAPRRVATGIEYNRVLQIIAVLERRVGLNLSKQDVYVSVVGGMEINEPAADLGIALAIVTCLRNVTIEPSTTIIGEIGLSGEIRPVNNIEARVNEAAKLGFKKAIIPKSSIKCNVKGIEIIEVSKLTDAITKAIG